MTQHSGFIVDQSKIKVAVSKDCNKISENQAIEAIIASSEPTRAKGLGGRKKQLRNNEGMLFVFDPAQKVSFWMKDTLIPLQIAYFDTEGRLLKLFEMPVETNPKKPKQTYPSDLPTQTALELKPKTLSSQLAKVGAMLCVNNPLDHPPADKTSAVQAK